MPFFRPIILAALALAACAPAPHATVAPTAYAPVPAAPAPAPVAEVAPGYTPPAFGKTILVNIPSAEVIAYENGVEVMRSRAVVGARRTQTPVEDTHTSVVRFRPSWRPTPTMVATGKYEDKVTPPGPSNPLGLAAIRLDPGNLIYLHGTNQPHHFAREARALSNGCVRVERLVELTAWLLEETPEQVEAWKRGRRTFDAAADGVPVHFRYYTRFPDADGVMRDWPDVYGRERAARAP
jgi:murein L,D-transpeptidase YcbB/YkuD